MKINDSNVSRPTLLSILCIITFIFSGISLIGALVNITGINPQVSETPLHLHILGAAFATGKIIGALMMFQLQKTGFWIYLSTQLGAFITRVQFASNSPSIQAEELGISLSPEQLMYITIAIIGSLSLLWIIGYATQLKAMK